MLTNPCRYIIALYGLYNVFLIDFDKKVFIIKVTLKKISFCLKPSKSEAVTFVKNFRKFLFQNSGVYINNFSQT